MGAETADSGGDFAVLRQEILESQKIRNDFLKYKLFAVAVLASVGLGLGADGQGPQHLHYVLCLIPLVCLYVDVICYHNNCRIRVLVQFLKYADQPYEQYLAALGVATEHVREKTNDINKVDYYYQLEDAALAGASVLMSGLLVAYAGLTGPLDSARFAIFLLFGVVGLSSTYAAHAFYTQRLNTLHDAQKQVPPPKP